MRAIALLALLCSSACVIPARGMAKWYAEPSIDRAAVSIRRVAILPNRLPLSIQDPERWRLFNWSVVKTQFVDHGFEVVDYQTSVDLFGKSGLPVEDTKSSRDKYADVSQQLGVDAIIIPYYATYAATEGGILTTHKFTSMATFQVYCVRQNDFIARVDATGIYQYKNDALLYAVGGAVLALVLNVSALAANDSATEIGLAAVGAVVGIGVPVTGVVKDYISGLGTAESHWEKAFRVAIVEGLKPFFATFPPPPPPSAEDAARRDALRKQLGVEPTPYGPEVAPRPSPSPSPK